ncbi:MAG: hypothetical protein NC093_03580 [Alistipes sp.]|nr:hypothetical protein [Alistipes sp.]
MKIVVISVAVVIVLAALFLLVKKLALMIGGAAAEAEIIGSREVKQGEYVHTLEFEFNGEKIIAEDKTGYSQAIPAGETRLIKVSRKDPKNFEYADTLRLHIIAAAVMAALGVLMVVRFAFFVKD